MPAERLPYPYAREWELVLLPAEDGPACIHYSAAPPPTVIAELQRRYGMELHWRQVSPEQMQDALTQVYEDSAEDMDAVEADIQDDIDLVSLSEQVSLTHDLLSDAEEAPIIRLINAIVSKSIQLGASDVHIETFEKRVSVRYRVDGLLRDAFSPSRRLAGMLASRIKVMAKLDIAERRLPQDGRMAVRVAGRLLDVRISTLPTRHGERVVLRLLEKSEQRISLAQLGMSSEQYGLTRQWLAKPHGVILVTGPTGSGKSTTLYAALEELNNGKLNILTVEDPVEVDLDGVGQTQVNHKIEMDFARGLRAILRQDPDVVMVGEIRDPETAAIAIQASLTGHLVLLSTLHTNTALGAIPRLIELGVEPFLLSSSLTAVMAQRLVRQLCLHCRQAGSPEPWEIAQFAQLDLAVEQLFRPQGCAQCGQTGYRGRTAIHEQVSVDQALKQLIHTATHDPDWQRKLVINNAALRRDGLRKAAQGITSLEEVLRVAGSGEEGIH